MKKLLSIKIVKYVIIVLVVAAVGFGGYKIYKNKTASTSNNSTVTLTPTKVVLGNLSVSFSGTGTVQLKDRYDIVPLVKGNILSSPFEEGDTVKAGDVLYIIDDTDLRNNIKKTQNSIDRLKLSNQSTLDSISKLEVVAPCDGRISGLTVQEGDELGTNSNIATIINDRELTATIPFSASQAKKINVGDKAQLLFQQYMSYVDGVVTYVGNTAKTSSDGTVTCDVEISFENPGVITDGMQARGVIKGTDEDIVSPLSGTVAHSEDYTLNAEVTGKIKQIYVKNDEWVTKGQKILTIENDSLAQAIDKYNLDMADLELTMDSYNKQIDDYNIVSPIDGTVISKDYKVGDTVNGSSSVTLMTVADLTKMVFTVNVDELDIAKISKGQKVNVTADALEGVQFEGEVTNVPMEGSSSNGVTTYPVEVTISQPGQLKPGMNVNGEIIVENKENTLYVPIAAVTEIGGKAYVFVDSSDTGSNDQSGQGSLNQGGNNAQQGTAPGSEQQGTSAPSDQQNTAGTNRQWPGNSSTDRQGSSSGSNRQWSAGSGQTARQGASTMAGKERKEVTIGINTDEYIEILSGLDEGETVYIPTVTGSGSSSSSTAQDSRQMGMFGGGGGMDIPGGGGEMGGPGGGRN